MQQRSSPRIGTPAHEAELDVTGATPPTGSLVGAPRVTVVIPALNEEDNLVHVLPRLPSGLHEVILVDDHCTDQTVRVARDLLPSIRIVENFKAKGKGNALQGGFAAATGDVIVMLDADGSEDPGEIPLFVGALMSGADFAKGSRFIHGGGTSDMPLLRMAGNKAFVWIVWGLYGVKFTDLCYGYNAFWTRVLPTLQIDADGFEVETMLNIRAVKAGLRIKEVPSFETERVHGIGRLVTFPDGWRVLKTIYRERFGSARRSGKVG
jgi:glycosyltransferase involved in cell wall biosynthesis